MTWYKTTTNDIKTNSAVFCDEDITLTRKNIDTYYIDIIRLTLGKIFQHHLFSLHLPCKSKIISQIP